MNNDLYTEKELIHQVSSNQVKRLTQAQQVPLDAAKQTFGRLYKQNVQVWSALSKFLKNQCD